MTTDHALFFIFNGPREGRDSIAMEGFRSFMAFWDKRKQAGDVAGFEKVMLASSGNADMPGGFMLVTGERKRLQELRWGNEDFLGIHTTLMTSMTGYACIDGYAGEGFEKHMARLSKVMDI